MKVGSLTTSPPTSTERRAAGGTTGAYAAFISYSHAADGKLAPALQRGLHGFARPWFRLRALRVFRDEASLSANPGLWSSIEQALASAEFFILLASPEAARSPWVGREVAYWLEHKSLATFLIVLTDGELVWNDVDGDFDRSRTTALPPSLRGVLSEDPRYVDLRWARVEEDVSLHNPRFRNAIADVAAPLHHRSKDELIGEDVRQHRRTIRWVRSAVAALTVLLILALTATVIAVNRQQTAEERQRLATARLLLTQADTVLDRNPRTALRLTEAAQRIHPDAETRAALVRNLLTTPYAGSLTGHTDAVEAVAFAPDGHTVATASWDGSVVLWDVSDPTTAHQLGAPITTSTGTGGTVAFAPDRHTLASTSWDSTNGSVILWDVSDPTAPHQLGAPLTGHTDTVNAVAFAHDGHTLATASDDGTAILWDVSDPAAPHRLGAPLIGPTDDPTTPNGVTAVAFKPDRHTLATTHIDGTVLLWDVSDPAAPQPLGPPLTGHTGTVFALAFAPDRHTLATAGEDGTVVLWDLTGLEWLRGHAMERACAITAGGLDRTEWARYVPGLPYVDVCRT